MILRDPSNIEMAGEPQIFFIQVGLSNACREKCNVHLSGGLFMTKKGFIGNIEQDTIANADFRRVLYTGKYSQLVLMSLKPGEEIGEEVHDDVDQFFRFEKGEGKVVIDKVEHKVHDGVAVIVPSGRGTTSSTPRRRRTFASIPYTPRRSIRTRWCATPRPRPWLMRNITTASLASETRVCESFLQTL